MDTIKEFDTINTAILALDVMDAMKKVASNYGLVVKLKTNSFIKHPSFTAQILELGYEFSSMSADGKSGRQLEFEKYAPMFGLKSEHFGATINLGGSLFKVVGVRPNATKNKIYIESVRGKEYVCSPRAVLNGLVTK